LGIGQNFPKDLTNRSGIPAQCISCRYNTGQGIFIHLKATLPYKNQLVKTNHPTRNYTTIYIGLTPQQAKKLRNLAKNQRKSESGALRQVLDAYLKDIENRDLPFGPYRKTSPIGMKVLPRTITIEQDRRLRKIAEKAGRRISEIVRDAVSFST